MSKCDGCIQEIRKLLDSAKREPAHSPTEDALIDSVEMLLEIVTDPTFRQSSSPTEPGAESREPEKLNNAHKCDCCEHSPCLCYEERGCNMKSLAESSLSSPPPESDLSAPTSPEATGLSIEQAEGRTAKETR